MSILDYRALDREIRVMATQRRDENAVFRTTHLAEVSGEEVSIEKTYDESSLTDGNTTFLFDQSEYKFAMFSDLIFGKETIHSPDEIQQVIGVSFYYCDFSLCGFSNITFRDCTFIGCNFTECYTLGFDILFEECSFMSRIKGKVSIDDAPCMFKSCELTVRFVESDLQMAVFDMSHFYFSHFIRTSLKDIIFVGTSFDTIKVSDCDLRNTKMLKPKFVEFYIEDAREGSKVSKHTFLDLIQFNPKEAREVRFAIETYSQISELFERNKLMDLAGEYFYRYKLAEKMSLTGVAKFKSFMGLISCGYGERPSHSLMTSLALIFFCGTLYMLFGVSVNNEYLQYIPTAANLFPSFDLMIYCYHFSLVTFSTVGYGNVVPVGGSLVVSAFEMVMGVIMVGIWVSTLVRKMVR